MKHRYLFLLLLFSCVLIATADAQNPVFIGKLDDVMAAYKKKAQAAALNRLSTEAQISYSLPGEPALMLKLQSHKPERDGDYFYGEVLNDPTGRFYMKVTNRQVSGAMVLHEQKKFYRYSSAADGSVYLTEEDIDKVLCVGLPKAAAASDRGASANPSQPLNQQSVAAAAPPVLESLPGAGAVLYLDFDGQTVTNTSWNRLYTNNEPIVAEPGRFTANEMTEVWKLMSEDFSPFAVNVTTSEAVFNNAPPSRRMRVIFTTTYTWYPSAVGGVAFIGSFTWGGTVEGETPCWGFSAEIRAGGEIGSHEAGHTVGLSHDGQLNPFAEYYVGHDNWGTIMGNGTSKMQVQWSKGEYPNANNTEDDLVNITTQNGFGYRPDDHGNTTGTATALVKDASGNVLASANKGIIGTRTDVDVFSFTTPGGQTALTISPVPHYANLDVQVTLRNAAGTVLVTDDPPADVAAFINTNLAAGTYYLTVDGVRGGLGANSDYASLGAYTIATTSGYCTPTYVEGCNFFPAQINNFSFHTLVNNSGCSNGTATGYTLYEPTGSFTTTVNRGQSYQLTMQSAPNMEEYFGVWIDYNQDKDFSDAGEAVYISPSASNVPFSATVTIPATAGLGTTRLRVRSSNDPPFGASDFCQLRSHGETEDYTITIAGGGTAPTVTLTAPTNGATYTAPATIGLAATASDADGSVTKVEFFNGTTKLGEDLTTPYTFSWTGVAAGTYALTARATDNSGLTKTSTAVSVTVNISNAITISSLAPASGAVGVGVAIKGTGFTNVTAVRFGSTTATQVYVASATLLYATVPSGAVTGKVQVVAGSVSALSASNFTVAAVSSTWSSKGGLLTARSKHGAVATNGRIYVMGGHNSAGLLRTVEIYNPTTNAWSAGASLPAAIRGMAIALGTNGAIYVMGGFTPAVTAAFYRYTPSSNSWTTLANLPVAVAEAAAAGANGRIYLFGGQTGAETATSNSTRIYNIATNSWSTGASMPVAVRQHSAVTGADGRIYVFGGRTGVGAPLDRVQIYNPATNTWAAGAPMLIPKVQFGAVLAPDGRIYIVGGKATSSNNTGPFFHTVEIYSPATNTWAAGPVLPIQNSELKAVSLNGNLHAVGGANGSYRNYNYQLIFKPAAPTVLKAAAASATQINLSWTDNALNETGFTVERATASAGPFSVVTTLAANRVSYSNTGLASGRTYYYRVKATNTAGSSAYSNVASATTPAAITSGQAVVGNSKEGQWTEEPRLIAYPNPVVSTARIEFAVGEEQHVQLGIYDMKGHLVSQLYSGVANAGARHQFTWDAGAQAAGTYFLRLFTAKGVVTQKILLTRGSK